MNAFSKIDMGEVTRLTQAGKLAEAMALLQGHTAPGLARGSPGSEVPRLAQGINAHHRQRSTWPCRRLRRHLDGSRSIQAGGARGVRSVRKAAGVPDLAQRCRRFGATQAGRAIYCRRRLRELRDGRRFTCRKGLNSRSGPSRTT